VSLNVFCLVCSLLWMYLFPYSKIMLSSFLRLTYTPEGNDVTKQVLIL
jgi:hypothetical protein